MTPKHQKQADEQGRLMGSLDMEDFAERDYFIEAGELLREAAGMLRELSEQFGQGVPALMYQPGLVLADRIDALLKGEGK